LNVASELSCQRGIRPVSVDQVTRKAGVGKLSLYRLFDSKDWLVLAYLDRHGKGFWNKSDAISILHPDNPREQLFPLIDWIANDPPRLTHPGYPIPKPAMEYQGADHPVKTAAVAHKRAVQGRLLQMAGQIGANEPALFADQLLLLIEGTGRPVPSCPGI